MRATLSRPRFWFESAAGLRFQVSCFVGFLLIGACVARLAAQQPNNRQQNFQNPLAAPGPQQNALFPGQNVGGNGPNAMFGPAGMARRGGAANADFDSLIDLIESTVATETWSTNGGGQAEIRPFPTGVLVDATGTLRLKTLASVGGELAAKRGIAPPSAAPQSASARRASALRYVSLTRLEREIFRRQAAHEKLDPAMLTLAGLRRIRYVFAYPESGDIVLAGPADDWLVDPNGRILSVDTREPVVRLDDLLVLVRRGMQGADSHFGCSINPRQEALAKTQVFLASSSRKAIEPSERKQWLSDLRDTVGKQDIEVFGIDPASRAASVLVEADYHMKLIGMGLADGVDGVESYLDSIHLRPGELPPAMSVLRWWFTAKYDSIAKSEAGDAYELVGQGVRVLSENEMLAEQGQRVHTGQSDPLNRQFAGSFTAHFAELVKKYPVYGELRNIFDLAMAVAIIQGEGLAEKVGWTPGLLANGAKLRLPQKPVPRDVETVINHRVINRRTILAGVSGGVMVAPADVLRDARATDSAATTIERAAPAPKELAANAWWWDGEK
jgi:hypothetical protein